MTKKKEGVTRKDVITTLIFPLVVVAASAIWALITKVPWNTYYTPVLNGIGWLLNYPLKLWWVSIGVVIFFLWFRWHFGKAINKLSSITSGLNILITFPFTPALITINPFSAQYAISFLQVSASG